MRYASDNLREEHEMILFGLNILEEMVSRLNDAQMVETEDLSDMLAFFKRFAGDMHHVKEERLYFPALEQAGIGGADGAIGSLLDDHDAGRISLERMETALAGSVFQPGEVAAGAAEYIALIRAHIEREVKLLFQLADERLTPEMHMALLEDFKRFETDVLGEGERDQMHELLACIDRKYPD